MERHEEDRVEWLIGKPGGLFLNRRGETLRQAGVVPVYPIRKGTSFHKQAANRLFIPFNYPICQI
jgi:hypothetical protein